MDKIPTVTYTAEEVSEWLKSNGFEAFCDTFKDEDVDGEAFACLSETALGSLVDKVGPRMKLLRIIKQMKRNDGDSGSSGGSNVSSWDLESLESPNSQDLPRSSSPMSSSPTPDQRRDVCRAIITTFPFLADVGGGYETWYRHLGDKVKNELRNETSDPVVLARKRKSVGDPELSTKVPTSRRGIINWDPPAVNGEDEATNRAHVSWMQKEYKRKTPNMNLVKQKMMLTFSFRRKLVNVGKMSLKEIDLTYPFLFEHEQLQDEYERLVSDENVKMISKNINELAPRILKVAQSRGIKQMAGLIEACLEDNEEEEDTLTDDEKVVVALSVLPHLLERPTKKNPHPENFLYQTADNPEALAKESSSPMSPYIIFCEDNNGSVNRIFIAAEKRVLMEADDILAAVS
ncbi:sterile alpha motif domain-containing 3-like isoform X1, partial [Paramuricea clavata]